MPPGLHPDAADAVLDPVRLDALGNTGLLDTGPEAEFDRLTALTAQVTGSPVSLVAFLDAERSFFKSAHGLPDVPPGRSVPFSHSLCQHVVSRGEAVVVDDLAADPVLRSNAAVTEMGAGAYLGVPVRSPSGHVIGTLCAIDVEARTWSEDDVSALLATAAAAQGEVALRAERQAREAAERLAQLKDALLSNMSHEIRTPLTAILGSAQILHDEMRGEARFLTDSILSGGRRLLGTMNAVLDLALIEAGRMEPAPLPTDVGALLEAVAADARPLAEAKDLAFVLDVTDGLPELVVDPDLLRRVVANLLDNAVKFTDGGAVAVRAQYEPGAPGRLRVEVVDTGVGIAREHVPHLFDEFHQVSAGDARTHEGSGLGLALVRRVVDLMGGEVGVESVPGLGSRFTVSLPDGA